MPVHRDRRHLSASATISKAALRIGSSAVPTACSHSASVLAMRTTKPTSQADGPQATHCTLTINDNFSDFAGLNRDGLRGKSLQGRN
jgi:hypothetical protein